MIYIIYMFSFAYFSFVIYNYRKYTRKNRENQAEPPYLGDFQEEIGKTIF